MHNDNINIIKKGCESPLWQMKTSTVRLTFLNVPLEKRNGNK